MKPCKPLNFIEISSLLSTNNINGNDQQLLNWAADSSIVDRIEVSMWLFQPSATVYRANVQLHFEKNTVIGSGRCMTKSGSIAKALAEAIERQTMMSFYSNNNVFNLRANIADTNSLRIMPALEGFSVPFDEFKTSNGWASHWNLSKAFENSKMEALERHILLYTYLKFGWNGFSFSNSGHWNEFEVYSAFSKVSSANSSAGICVALNKAYTGMLFGYLADSTDSIVSSTKWVNALYEMYDAFTVAKNKLKTNGFFEYYQTDIGKYGNYWLSKKPPNFNCSQPIVFEDVEVEDCYAEAFEVSEMFEMDFPYYVTTIGFGNLIPLFFETSPNEKLRDYLSKKLNCTIQSDLNEILWHPIL